MNVIVTVSMSLGASIWAVVVLVTAIFLGLRLFRATKAYSISTGHEQ